MLFDGTGESHQVSTNNGYEPLWSPDGSEIYYTEENRASGRLVRKMMAVDVQTEPAFEASPPRLLFEGEYLRNDLHRWIRNHDLSPDGQRFLMIESEKEALPATKVKFVLNWFSELERLVPTR